jgi:alcohol dehydrogenase
MIGKPAPLTLSTGLDALSHALESIWNVNANPVSARYAVGAAQLILDYLPPLIDDLGNLDLRSKIAQAALYAGLAFSNTKTAIAHNISYPITLRWGVPHGIACSFTLPTVLRSMAGVGGFRESSLNDIFGSDLQKGSDTLARFMTSLGVGIRFADYGIQPDDGGSIVDAAFAGDRGRNFAGTKDGFLTASLDFGLIDAT